MRAGDTTHGRPHLVGSVVAGVHAGARAAQDWQACCAAVVIAAAVLLRQPQQQAAQRRGERAGAQRSGAHEQPRHWRCACVCVGGGGQT